MKSLCTKPGKGGKIHPSPLGGGGDGDPVRAALRLLPAAIFALATALLPEDQQVLAYLVTRCLQGAGAAHHPEQPPVRGRRRRAHLPAIGCGCFDCYTSFWSRWDCSPSRELIHDAIEAFEDHLAAAESSSTPTPSSSSKRREKGKRRPPPPQTPAPMSPKSSPVQPPAEKVHEPSPPPSSLTLSSSPPPLPPAPEATTTFESDDYEKVPEDPSAAVAAEENASEGEEEEEERKRGWADVMGMLNLRLWGIWSPAVESAT
ncbi:leucine-rich repeat extensin-like protein 3 [Oryza brachyantha]|nr:leucine-rich repeat extensin-like protein 3 [Oryza brachyantha]